jgi:hypothetical protein
MSMIIDDLYHVHHYIYYYAMASVVHNNIVLHPESQSTKKYSANLLKPMMKPMNDVIYFKMFSSHERLLGLIIRTYSVEEIMDYR